MPDDRSIDRRPNVVLVHCHDLGRYLGCYGRPVDTPNIDAIAANGVRFDRYFAASPTCSPSRASMYTGRYPREHGVMGLTHLGWDLDSDVRTLPDYLGDAGYETHLFGTRHASRWPERLGYDDYHGYDERNEGEHDIHQRVETFANALGEFDDPVLATIGFNSPHRPFRKDIVSDEEYDRYDPDGIEVPPFLPNTDDVRADLAEFTALMTHGLDPAVGSVRDAIHESGLAEDTLLVFTTDHGVDFPGAKETGRDHGLGIALLAEHPDLPDGAVNDDLLCNVDLLPTLHDLAGGDPPTDLDGRTFLPAVEERPYQARTHVYAEGTWHGGRPKPFRSVRTDRFRYVENYLTDQLRPDQPEEQLYDLQDDPHERENLASDRSRDAGPPVFLDGPWESREPASEPEPGYEDVLDTLRRRLHRWMVATDDPLVEGTLPLPNHERTRLPDPRN
jgi:arylsulfatase A-like enzyme